MGRLIGIARKAAYRAPLELLEEAELSAELGVAGDYKGAKYPRRAVTVLAREAWETTLAELGAEAAGLDWTVRRANLLVEGVELPRALGGTVRIGQAVLEITYPTVPCARMDEAFPGLKRALYPEWRGGITCRVLEAGRIAIGDAVEVLHAPPERKKVKLPG